MRFDYRILIELLTAGGDTAGRMSVEPDWEPAIEWTRLAGLRTRGLWLPGAAAERGIEPLWHDTLGEPYMRGFRVHLAGEGEEWYEDFSSDHFAALAREATARLVEAKIVEAGERVLFRTLAYPEPPAGAAPAPQPAAFGIVECPPPLTIREASRSARIVSSSPAGDTHPGDFDVFVPAHVMEEAAALTAQAGDVETGGVLIGHLAREQPDADLFVEITALVPARHTVGASTTLTFTSETWTDVRRAVELRRRNEMLLGWFHSHPQDSWCRKRGCPVEQQRRCSAADGFFSADDLALHRTMFPRAFTVALLMTRSVKGILPRLFGWRAGRFEPRGFRVIAAEAATGVTHVRTSTMV